MTIDCILLHCRTRDPCQFQGGKKGILADSFGLLKWIYCMLRYVVFWRTCILLGLELRSIV